MPMKISTNQLVKDNKDILFDLLEKTKVNSFDVSFDGSGDSGQIEDIALAEKVLNKKVEGARVSNGTTWDPITKQTTINWQNDVDVRGLIEGICYDTLEESFGGWEINDGSFGTFRFDVKKRKVILEMNERVMDVNYKEFTF